MDEKSVENRNCWHCRRELTESNSWMPTEGFDRGGPVPYCIPCQNIYYRKLATLVGNDLAYYFCCVKFDVPYIAKSIKTSYKYRSENGPWGGYIVALRAARFNKRKDKWFGFADGETNIKKALKDLADIGAETPEEEDERIGRDREENIEFWGKGPKGGAKYTDDDYDALNRVYDAMAEGRGGMSEQSRLAIQTIAKWTLSRDKLMDSGEFDNAKKLTDMIEKLKESEQLRKKDELPQDRTRIDDIVLAVERAGLNMMNYDELCKQLSKYMFHTPYGYTRDDADQMLLMIRNCTAFNEGVPEVDRLDSEYAIVDNLGEFAKEPDEREKETYKELGLVPLKMKRGK